METKICIECNTEKELHNFAKEGPKGAFVRNKCKSCVRIWNKLPKEEREAIKAAQKDIIRTRIEKVCPSCNTLKPKEAFYNVKSNLDKLSSECRDCDDHRNRTRRNELRDIHNKSGRVGVDEKTCNKCGDTKTINEFSRNITTGDGFSHICKSCVNTRWGNNTTPERRVNYLLERIRYKCNKLDIPFDLDLSDLVIPTHCPVLGIPLVFGNVDKGYSHHASEGSPSIDRIDPEGGYVKGNVVVISWRANRIKGNASIQELIKIADYYKQFCPVEE